MANLGNIYGGGGSYEPRIIDLEEQVDNIKPSPAFIVHQEAELIAQINEAYLCDFSENNLPAISVKLPPEPSHGDSVIIGDFKGECSILKPIVITSDDEPIEGIPLDEAEPLYLTSGNIKLTFQYMEPQPGEVAGRNQGWKIVDGIGEGSSPEPYEEVIIAPIHTSTLNQRYNLTGDLTWGDFERIEVSFVTDNDRDVPTVVITKDRIAAGASTRFFRADSGTIYSDGSRAILEADTSTSCFVSTQEGQGHVSQIKGYTKYKPVLNRGVTTLWEGRGEDNTDLTFSEPLSNFDMILIEMDAVDTSGSGDTGVISAMYRPQSMLAAGDALLFQTVVSGSATTYSNFQLINITNTTARYTDTGDTYNVPITGVYGIKY